MRPWAAAFVTALGLTVLAVPLLRKLALVTDFVDRPESRKSHVRPVPYLGGVALIGSVLLAILVEQRLPARIGGLTLGAALIGTMGLIDDDRSLHPGLRFLAEVGAATVAVVLGLRIHATGIPSVDVLLTLIWIVGITNAMNLLDNMDGLAAGVTAAAAAALFCLAVAPGEEVTATVAAALAGACLGFLVYNRRPASVFMGDAGSLFLGFVLAVLTVDIDPALVPPASFAIPVIVLSLPILDTTMVTLARLRRGKAVSQGGRDHLSHRLVARGLSPGRAVLVLIGVETALGGIAVLAGREVVALPWAAAAVAAVLLALSAVTARAEVYSEPVVGLTWRLRAAAAAGALGVLLLAGPALLALARADGPARAGAAAANRALASLGPARNQDVVAALQSANADFARARSRLRSPLASVGLVVPGVSTNLKAARTLAETGFELTSHALQLASLSDGSRLPVDLSDPPVDEVGRLAPLLSDALQALNSSNQQLVLVRAEPYLVPSLRRTADRLFVRVRQAERDIERAASLAHLVPSLLGQNGTRRYLVAFQDGRDLRATGGSITCWGELVAVDGSLRLEGFQAGADSWNMVDLSPDFPTAAGTIRGLYEAAVGRHLDGVLAVDATGLARLQELVGSRLNLDGAADVVHSAWDAILTAPLGTAASVGRALADASGGGHMLLALTDPQEQQLAARFGIDGALPMANADSLLVLNETGRGAAAGVSLRRQVRYEVQLEPGSDDAAITGKLELTLTSTGDAATTSVSVLSPFPAQSATVDGQSFALASTEHLGRRVGSATVDVPAGSVRVVRMELAGRVRLPPGGWYGLEVIRQPALTAEDFVVSIGVPHGWRIAEVRGLHEEGRRVATATLDSARRHALWVRLERSGWSGIWHSLLHGR